MTSQLQDIWASARPRNESAVDFLGRVLCKTSYASSSHVSLARNIATNFLGYQYSKQILWTDHSIKSL